MKDLPERRAVKVKSVGSGVGKKDRFPGAGRDFEASEAPGIAPCQDKPLFRKENFKMGMGETGRPARPPVPAPRHAEAGEKRERVSLSVRGFRKKGQDQGLAVAKDLSASQRTGRGTLGAGPDILTKGGDRGDFSAGEGRKNRPTGGFDLGKFRQRALRAKKGKGLSPS